MTREIVNKVDDVDAAINPDATTSDPVARTSLSDRLAGLGNVNIVLLASATIATLMVLMSFIGGSANRPAQAAINPTQSVALAPVFAPDEMVEVSHQSIERKGEGRHFYTTIKIPPAAETLYLSGSGAAQKPDGTWGTMEEQTIDTFTRFKETLEAEGWTMSDIVQVRAFAKAGEFGLLDFDGFNRGYREFFGTEANPSKPVRSFVQIADLVVPGWLVEIEIRAARMPQS